MQINPIGIDYTPYKVQPKITNLYASTTSNATLKGAMDSPKQFLDLLESYVLIKNMIQKIQKIGGNVDQTV